MLIDARARYQITLKLARAGAAVRIRRVRSLSPANGRRLPPRGTQSAAALRGDGMVLVEQVAESVAAPDAARHRWRGWRRLGERRTLLERTVRTVLVVMADVGTHDLLEVTPAEYQDSVEAFAAQAAHPPLGVCLGERRRLRSIVRVSSDSFA